MITSMQYDCQNYEFSKLDSFILCTILKNVITSCNDKTRTAILNLLKANEYNVEIYSDELLVFLKAKGNNAKNHKSNPGAFITDVVSSTAGVVIPAARAVTSAAGVIMYVRRTTTSATEMAISAAGVVASAADVFTSAAEMVTSTTKLVTYLYSDDFFLSLLSWLSWQLSGLSGRLASQFWQQSSYFLLTDVDGIINGVNSALSELEKNEIDITYREATSVMYRAMLDYAAAMMNKTENKDFTQIKNFFAALNENVLILEKQVEQNEVGVVRANTSFRPKL